MIPELERRWNPPDTMVDQYGNVHTLYKDHSIPPSAIDAKRIADICRILGTVYHGTVIAGKGEGVDKKTARVVLGQDAKGIQAYDDASRSFFALNWEDQSFRLGYIDSPQVRMRSGNVEIDGDCIVNGTLSANKILVGDSWVTTMIGGGLLAIGSGDGETPDNPADLFSGFRVSHATASASGKSAVWQRRAKVAGFLAGEMTFAIDTATGELISQGADADDNTYTKVSAGSVEIANLHNTGDNGALLKFTSLRVVDDETVETGSTGVYLDGDLLTVQRLASEYSYVNPGIQLRDEAGQTWSAWRANTFELRYPYSPSYRTLIGVDMTQGYVSTDSGMLILSADSRSGLSTMINLTPDRLGIEYGLLSFRNGELGWQARPAAPGDYEMVIRPDPINHRIEYWNGLEWRYLQDAAA